MRYLLAGLLLVGVEAKADLNQFNQQMQMALQGSESFARAGERYEQQQRQAYYDEMQRQAYEEQQRQIIMQAKLDRARTLQAEIAHQYQLYRKAKTDTRRQAIELQINRLEGELERVWR